MIQASRSDGRVSTALQVDALQVLQHTKGAGNTILHDNSVFFTEHEVNVAVLQLLDISLGMHTDNITLARQQIL